MKPHERAMRLVVSAAGLAMTIAAVALFVMLFRQDRTDIAIIATLMLMPMLWTAPVLLLAHEGDALNRPRFRGWAARAATVVLLWSGTIFVISLISTVQPSPGTRYLFDGVALVGTYCFGLPAGLVCLAYLTALMWKRVFREPDEGAE